MQVLSYEYRMSALAHQRGEPVHFDDWDQPPADNKALEAYYDHLQKTLETLSFLEPGNPRQTMTRLRRLYNRIRLDDMELSIMRGILTATNNYIYHTDNKVAELEQELNSLREQLAQKD